MTVLGNIAAAWTGSGTPGALKFCNYINMIFSYGIIILHIINNLARLMHRGEESGL
jgi:hypothetical protein